MTASCKHIACPNRAGGRRGLICSGGEDKEVLIRRVSPLEGGSEDRMLLYWVNQTETIYVGRYHPSSLLSKDKRRQITV